jgi:hypothetical protein
MWLRADTIRQKRQMLAGRAAVVVAGRPGTQPDVLDAT